MRTLTSAAAAGLLVLGSTTLALAQSNVSAPVTNPAGVSGESTTGAAAKQNWAPGPLSPAAEAAGDDRRPDGKHSFNTPTRYGSTTYVPPDRVPPVSLNDSGSENKASKQ